MFINKGSPANSRLGNEIIIFLVGEILQTKYDMYHNYISETRNRSNIDKIFSKKITKPYDKENLIHLTEKDIENLLNNNYNLSNEKNYIISNSFCQDPKIIKNIINFITNSNNNIRRVIEDNNNFFYRYKNNNDLFIHIRAGDVFVGDWGKGERDILPGLEYYDNILSQAENKYENIYLASDHFNSELVKKLKEKYKNIIFYSDNEINTIFFGSTCKDIVISSGSFSFIIGLFGFYSNNIFFSEKAGLVKEGSDKVIWHPNYYPELINNNNFILK